MKCPVWFTPSHRKVQSVWRERSIISVWKVANYPRGGTQNLDCFSFVRWNNRIKPLFGLILNQNLSQNPYCVCVKYWLLWLVWNISKILSYKVKVQIFLISPTSVQWFNIDLESIHHEHYKHELLKTIILHHFYRMNSIFPSNLEGYIVDGLKKLYVLF